MPTRILVVDDQRNVRVTLGILLRAHGYEVREAEDAQSALRMLGEAPVDVLLTDLRLGGMDGLELQEHALGLYPDLQVILMTAHATIDSAVEAMRKGAADYLQKPFSESEILIRLERAAQKRKLTEQVNTLAHEFRDRYKLENIVGRSLPVREVLGRIIRVAPTDTTVLITGPSGTGKELVARAVHANSARATRPFVSINSAAITETLLESELFGHVRGAFTGAVAARKGLFEEADGGTFFFDEIAETPMSFQVKLLRAIQEGEIRRLGDNQSVKVNVRVIAATNQDLLQAIADKRFREDLYYRLNVVRFHLPPLRDRREDIPILVAHFLQKYAKKLNRPNVRLGDGVLEYLTAQDFPGNVRELENMIEQGVALSQGDLIGLDDVASQERSSLRFTSPQSLAAVVDRAEKDAIEAALQAVDGNRERAAEVLGLSPTTLWRKMRRLQVKG